MSETTGDGYEMKCEHCKEEMFYDGVEFVHLDGSSHCRPIGHIFWDETRFTHLICVSCVYPHEMEAIMDERNCAGIYKPQTFVCKRCGEDIK